MAKVWKQRVPWRLVCLIAFEMLLIAVAVVSAAYVRLGHRATEMIAEAALIPKGLLIAAVTQTCLYFYDLYDLRVVADRRELFIRSVHALGATSLILALLYYWFPDLVIGRGVFVLAATMVVLLVLGWRATFDVVTRYISPRERLLLVGTSEAAVRLARELHDRRDFGIEVVGFIDPDRARVGVPVFNPGIIGTLEDIPAIVRARTVDRVVVSLADARGKLPMEKLLDLKMAGVTFEHLASVYEEYTGKIAVENLRPSWLIFAEGFRKSAWLRMVKRTIDAVGAVVGLVLMLPLLLAVAIAVWLTSGRPVFYRQQRVGRQGRLFNVWKFRTMRQDAEAETGAVWAQAGDGRVTKIGSFLRRSRLDELPQLVNVLKGEMSFVGPRPERPEFVRALTEKIPFYGQRHAVRPGLTGWAQVLYTYGASVEDALEKLQYDLFYIKNMTIALDCFIILKTVKIVLLQRGAR